MTEKIKTGNKGEQLAAEFLQRKGFEIVEKNYRFRHAEIDLIIKKEDWIIFIEVKTRTSTAFGEPEEFVGETKTRKMFEAAEEYIYSTDWHGHIRFDIVSVKLGYEVEIEHFEDAIN